MKINRMILFLFGVSLCEFYSLGIFMTSLSSSEMEFTCIFYDVFDVGGYASSSLLEGPLLYMLGIPPLPLLSMMF